MHKSGGVKSRNIGKIVDAKFYFAGGNARNFFERSIDDIIAEVRQALEDPGTLVLYLRGPGQIVTPYMETCMSERVPPEMLPIILEYLKPLHPDSVRSFMRVVFFSWALVSDFRLLDSKSKSWWKWSCGPRMYVFSNSDPEPESCVPGHWLKPTVSPDSGYDAVYLGSADGRTESTITFVRITHESNVQMDLQPMNDLIEKFESKLLFIPTRVRIFCVTAKNKLDNLFVGAISNITALERFGWSGDEATIRGKIERYGIDYCI